MGKINQDIEAAVELYIAVVASEVPFEPIRATQLAIWASNELDEELYPTTVLKHLRRLAKRGLLLQTCSHSPYCEHHFYINQKRPE